MPVAAAGRAWGRGQMRRESGGVAREHAAAREMFLVLVVVRL